MNNVNGKCNVSNKNMTIILHNNNMNNNNNRYSSNV